MESKSVSRVGLTLAAVQAVLVPGALAQLVEPESVEQAVYETWAPAPVPSRLAERHSLSPLAALDSAAQAESAQLRRLQEWNLAGSLPAQNGFSRPLEVERIHLESDLLTAGSTASPLAGGLALLGPADQVTWGAKVRVRDAYRLRLHLADIELPPETRIWVYGEDGDATGPVGLELLATDGGLWTPSVAGPEIRIEVVVPRPDSATRPGFTIDRVLEIFRLDPSGRPITARPVGGNARATGCLVNAQCVGPATFDVIESVQRAIAYLQFIVGGSGFQCTGGLLSDTDPSTVRPYLLTAEHCISSQSTAATLEAFWDFYSRSCSGSPPSLGSLSKSVGGNLLVSGPGSDFSFLRLSSIPSNRFLLGWNASPSAVGASTPLHRVSHPLGRPQHYSRTLTVASPEVLCSGWPDSRYLYSDLSQGAVAPGSSGAPVLLTGGYTVGQATGVCGFAPDNPCSALNRTVDGRFSTTYPAISQYLGSPIVHTLAVSKTGPGSGTVTADSGDIDCGGTCSDEYAEGTVVRLATAADAGSVFAGWGGDSDCLDGDVTMVAERNCVAAFDLTAKTLSVANQGSGGGKVTSSPPGVSCGGDCSEAFEHGTVVELAPVPAPGSAFAGWGGDADCLDGEVTMTMNLSCAATFDLLPTYSVSVSREGTGSGVVDSVPSGIACGVDCDEEYVEGTRVLLVGTPASGSELTAWSGDTDCLDGWLIVTGERTCVATFNPCTTQSEVTFENSEVNGTETVTACNRVHIGPGVRVTGVLEVHAGNRAAFFDGVEISPGGELKVVLGQPLP